MVRIEAKRCRIFRRTLSQAVTSPASAPASAARAVAMNAFQPKTISVAATAAPRGKLPSTVRSGNCSTRKERNTPSATSPKTRPISTAPRKAMRLMTSFLRRRGSDTANPNSAPQGGRRMSGAASSFFPLPLDGGGRGGGDPPAGPIESGSSTVTPHPDPPPQGGREFRPDSDARLSKRPTGLYSTTVLASATTSAGMVTPMASADLGLTASSVFSTPCTAMSPGFSPMSTRATIAPVWRPTS
jgi:hypothetical protein